MLPTGGAELGLLGPLVCCAATQSLFALIVEEHASLDGRQADAGERMVAM